MNKNRLLSNKLPSLQRKLFPVKFFLLRKVFYSQNTNEKKIGGKKITLQMKEVHYTDLPKYARSYFSPIYNTFKIPELVGIGEK